jgi:hypothetical protein
VTDYKPLYVINKDGDGCGNFLCPPGHPNFLYTAYGYYGGRRKADPDSVSSLTSLIENEYGDVPEPVQARAQQIMADARLVYSERWVRSVYGYFRNSYAPPSGSRDVSDAVSTGKVHCVCGDEFWNERGLARHVELKGDGHHRVFPPAPPAERHLGYLTVHDYFPGHAPRLDLIADPGAGYGAHPCAKCGQQVQYEARRDALCVVTPGRHWSYNAGCPQGGAHLVDGETG